MMKPVNMTRAWKLLAVLSLAVALQGCFSDCPKNDTLGLKCGSQITEPESFEETIAYPEYNDKIDTESELLKLRRITDNKPDDETPPLRHHYSKRQAWNADETLLDLNQQIVTHDTLEDVLGYIPLSSERNWSNLFPDELYGIRFNPEGNELAKFNITTEEYDSIYRFEQFDNCTLGQYEGNLTYDDKYIVVACAAKENGEKTLFSVNIEKKTLIGTLKAEDNFNWASFSYKGRYIVVENNTYPDPEPRLIRYAADLTNPVVLSHDPQHGDLTIDEDGNEVYAMIRSRVVNYIRLADRLSVNLDIGGAVNALSHGHISCRNFKRPGWCYISSGQHGHIGAVKLGSAGPLLETMHDLDGKSRSGPNAYEHWGFHRTSAAEYASTAKATVSPTGTKVLFTTDWFGEQPINDFILELVQPEVEETIMEAESKAPNSAQVQILETEKDAK